jgi:hypothetical protein
MFPEDRGQVFSGLSSLGESYVYPFLALLSVADLASLDSADRVLRGEKEFGGSQSGDKDDAAVGLDRKRIGPNRVLRDS